MKPINFEGVNRVYAADQKEYQPLPVYAENNDQGSVISIWKPTLRERIQILFGRKIALSQWTFNQPLQPVLIYVVKVKEKTEKQEE